MSGFDVEIREEKKTWKMALMWGAVVYAVLAAIFFAYFSVFEVEIVWKYVLLVLGVAIPVPMLLLWNQKYRVRKVVGAALVLGGGAFLLYEKLYAGFAPFVNQYIILYNKYYIGTVTTMIANRDESAKLLVLWLVGTIFSTILLYVLVKKKGLILAVAVILAPVILSAIVGKMPITLSCWGLMAAACSYIVVYHHRETYLPYREWSGAALILAVLFVISSVIQPMITDYKNTHIEEYKAVKENITKNQNVNLDQLMESVSKIGSSSSNFGGGGISKGNLKGVTSFNPTGETAMEIVLTERPSQTVYLKAFVGSEYTGESWDEISSFEFADMISPIGGAAKRRALMNEPFRRINEGTSDYTVNHMKLSLVNASSEFAYTPYYTQITDDYDVHLDSYVKGGWAKEREYDYYTDTPLEFLYGSSRLYSAYQVDTTLLADASSLWSQYQEFVKETYVGNYPELEQLQELCEGLDSSSVSALSSEMFEMFEISFRYTRNPREMPEDADFAEGFLFQRREGFCVHFATAATLIYQISGAPARYVEGYAISADQFQRDSDGTYRAVVTDENAHAWCEVFNEELGWMPKEFTRSYNGDVDMTVEIMEDNPVENVDNPSENTPEVDNSEEPEEDLQNQESTDSENENPKENDLVILPGDGSDGKSSGIGKAVKEFLIKGVKVACGIWILFFLWIMQYKIRRGKKLKKFRQKDTNRGILEIYHEIYELCIFAGVKISGKSEKEEIQKMSEMFSVILEEEWNWIYDIAEQAAFSGKVFSAGEQKKMYRFYQRLRRDILKNLNWRKKIWFLYGKVM